MTAQAMTKNIEDRLAKTIGWGILIAMGLAIALGGSAAIGIVSGTALVVLMGYVSYLYWQHLKKPKSCNKRP